MGNLTSLPEAPRDFRIDRTQRVAQFSDDDLKIFFRQFQRFDRTASGWLTAEDFFVFGLEIRRSIMTDGIYELIGKKPLIVYA